MEEKKKRGGARIGAGRKHRYGEVTTNITIRVPASHKKHIHQMVMEYLSKFVIDKK